MPIASDAKAATPRTTFVRDGVLCGIAAVAIAFSAQPLAIGSIHAYQRRLSPLAERLGMRCRFTPTCSRYAEAVVARDGVVAGGWKTLRRVARCGPWTPQGTIDEP